MRTRSRGISPSVRTYAPLPPHRPKGLAEVAALADIPLPPIRPTSLDAAEHEIALSPTDDVRHGGQAGAGELVAHDHPLPPAHSQILALGRQARPRRRRPATRSPSVASIAGTKKRCRLSAPAKRSRSLDDRPSPPRVTSSLRLVPLDHPLTAGPSDPVRLDGVSSPQARGSAAADGLPGGRPLERVTATEPQPGQSAIRRASKALFDAAQLVPLARRAGSVLDQGRERRVVARCASKGCPGGHCPGRAPQPGISKRPLRSLSSTASPARPSSASEFARLRSRQSKSRTSAAGRSAAAFIGPLSALIFARGPTDSDKGKACLRNQ